MKEVKKALYPNKTPSPLGSEERESNPPTYDNFDPSQPFAPYASQALDAPPPPPEQSRPSMADQLAEDIFGAPLPCMASSSHTSLTHTSMPLFFDSSLYTEPGSHWAAPHDYALHDQDEH
jgi:hypothetical protein